METVCKKLENCQVEVQVTYSGDEWATAQTKALNRLAQNVKMDGFRAGHVPAKLVKARLGKGAIYEEATDALLQNSYSSILLDNDIRPVAQPEVKIDEVNDDVLKLTVVATVAPEVELGQYKGLEVKKTQVKVMKKEIEEELQKYQEQFAELVIKEEGTVAEGDTVVIDFEGFKDGVAFDGGKSENYSLEIGSHSFIPGFEEQIVGMGIEEEKDIDVTFPEDYQSEDLAGQAAVFKIKVHEIKYKVLPEIDDELAKDVNIDGIETLSDLEIYIKEQIKNRKQSEVDRKFSEDIRNAVIANTPFDVPAAMVNNEVETMIREVEQSLSQQGVNLDLYTQLTGKTVDDMKAEMHDEAENRVKFNLIINEVVKAENIEATDEEVDEELANIASYYGKNVDEIKQIFNGQFNEIKMDIAARKAVQLIKDNVQ